MKDFIPLSDAANRQQYSIGHLLRLGEYGDLPMYIEGKHFILSPDFLTAPAAALAIPLTGLFAFKYSGPIRLSTGAISIVREKGSVTTQGPQTFFYLKDHTRENFTPLLSHIHHPYRELPPSSYDFFYNQKPLYVTLKSSEPKTVGILDSDLPILVTIDDVERLFAPKPTTKQDTFTDIVIDIAKQRLKNYPDLIESFLYHKVNHPMLLGTGISSWESEFIRRQGLMLTSIQTPPEAKNSARNEFIIRKIDDWLREYQEEHGEIQTIAPVNLGTTSHREKTELPKRQRQDLLTPIINKLQSQCTDPFSAAELWPKLVSLASGEDPPAPLIGYNDDFIKWEKELDKIAHLSKKALSERLRKQKNRRL